MVETAPDTAQGVAEVLQQASQQNRCVLLEGNGSKRTMAGPCAPAELRLSTSALGQVLEFEPRDLTIRVGAGLLWRQLEQVTAERGLCVPLDPMFRSRSSVGGVVAANLSGPRRRGFGTARDLVIGMEYATVDGNLLESGGMVVKNVAGLDIQKLLIGSYGTLAAITSVNFKLSPLPEATRTWVIECKDAAALAAVRDGLLRGVLQPVAMDGLNPAASRRCGLQGYALVLRAQGPESVLQRYRRELPDALELEGSREHSIWESIREFVPSALAANPDSIVVRTGWPMPDVASLLSTTDAPMLLRAGTGIALMVFGGVEEYRAWIQAAGDKNWSRLIEFAPESLRSQLELWPDPGPELDLMRSMKAVFDPQNVLNPGRLYGRI